MSHWKKLDHLAFLAMLFCLISAFVLYVVNISFIAADCLLFTGITLWVIAFIYDLMEEHRRKQ